MKNILKGKPAALLALSLACAALAMAGCNASGDDILSGSHISFTSGTYELIIELQDTSGRTVSPGSQYSLYDNSAGISYGTVSAVSGTACTFSPASGAENNFTAHVNIEAGTVTAFIAKKNDGTSVSIPAMAWGPPGTWKATIPGIGVCELTVAGTPASGTWTLSIAGYGEYDRGIYTGQGNYFEGYSTLIEKTTAAITIEGSRKMKLVLNQNSYAPGTYTLLPIDTKHSLGINRHRKF